MDIFLMCFIAVVWVIVLAFFAEYLRVCYTPRHLLRIAEGIKELTLIKVISDGVIEAPFGELRVDRWGIKSMERVTKRYEVSGRTRIYICSGSDRHRYALMDHYGGNNQTYVPYDVLYEIIKVYPQLLKNLDHTERTIF